MKFVLYANALALIATIVAPAISAYAFVKFNNRLLSIKEAMVLTYINSTPVFVIFAVINSPELNEPYTGWLLG